MTKVILIGQANVGKSSLFNAMANERKALISKQAHTTRDTNWKTIQWNTATFLLGDCAGFESTPQGDASRSPKTLRQAIEKKILSELTAADITLLVLDGEKGILPNDRALIRFLKKAAVPFFIVVNKIDGAKDELHLADFSELTVAPLFATSAVSGLGVGTLLDSITERITHKQIPTTDHHDTTQAPIRIALIGKTNVGKSTLMNTLLQKDIMIVSPDPHTTREPHDEEFISRDGTRYTIVDTAGIRRKSQLTEMIDIAGTRMSLRELEHADCVLFLLDLSQPATAQDLALARIIAQQKKPCIIIANKYDIAHTHPDNKHRLGRIRVDIAAYIRSAFPFLSYSPILLISALRKQYIADILPTVRAIVERNTRIIPLKTLEEFLARTLEKRPAPVIGVKKRKVEVRGLFQNEHKPYQFILKVFSKEPVPIQFVKYIEKRLAIEFDFSGVPLELTVENLKEYAPA